ncbi:hypothetical protein ACJ41O_015163 [Fusarium nematophilum]
MRPLPVLFHSLLVSTATAAKRNRDANSGTVWATPHDSYSSSIGVDTNRVAYWPNSVDCSNICVSLSYQDRSVFLLRVDQSEGAHDVSYDAWNYLYTGYSASEKPAAGGPVEMQFENVAASECKHLLDTEDGRLPLSAANSMNFLTSCLDQNDTWVGDNYVLYNILDSICTLGHDETCNLDYPAANQASCPHTLGLPDKLDGAPVYNIRYPSGETIRASDGQAVGDQTTTPDTGDEEDEEDAASGLAQPSRTTLALVFLASSCLALGL